MEISSKYNQFYATHSIRCFGYCISPFSVIDDITYTVLDPY